MNHVALEVAEYLEDSGIGTVNTNIFVDRLPDNTNNVISVFTTGGSTPDIDLPIPYPSFEVLVRNISAQTGYEIAESIADLLHRTYNSTLLSGGNYYYSILLQGEVNLLGRDEKDRIEYSVNFRCRVRDR